MGGLVDHARTSGSGSGTTEPEPPPSAPGDARQRRLAARSLLLSELMRERVELRGVHDAADLAVEAVRWCA